MVNNQAAADGCCCTGGSSRRGHLHQHAARFVLCRCRLLLGGGGVADHVADNQPFNGTFVAGVGMMVVVLVGSFSIP